MKKITVIIFVILLCPISAISEIIFETDWSNDTGYSESGHSLWSTTAQPTGWTAIKTTFNSSFSVINDTGLGKNVLKLSYDGSVAQPTLSLAKHLTGNKNTGYSEVYIRYRVKFSDAFEASDDGLSLDYWKWGRLWQNTGPTNDGTWTENRVDSFYIMWTWANNIPFTGMNATWGANEGVNLDLGSAGGERYKVDYYVSGATEENQPGYFEHVSDWDLYKVAESAENAGKFKASTQGWHTIEYHFKLATSDAANDGVQELYFDGVNQGAWTEILEGGGAPTKAGIPTSLHGSGFNFFVFFDNMSGWNETWSNGNSYILVADVVVSTTPVGAGYTVGGPLHGGVGVAGGSFSGQ